MLHLLVTKQRILMYNLITLYRREEFIEYIKCNIYSIRKVELEDG